MSRRSRNKRKELAVMRAQAERQDTLETAQPVMEQPTEAPKEGDDFYGGMLPPLVVRLGRLLGRRS